MSSDRLFLVAAPLALACSLGIGCGDDDGAPADGGGDSDVVTDATTSDGEADGDVGGPDAGPPPSCSLTPSFVTFAPDFDGDRDEDPTDFAAIEPGGPWAFAYKATEDMGMMTRESRIEVRTVDATGTDLGLAVLESQTAADVRLDHARAQPAGGGLFAVWSRGTTDAAGALVSTQVMFATVGATGAIAQPAMPLFEMATSPFLATDAPSDVWVERSDVEFLGAITGVTPRIQHLDASGAEVDPAVPLMSHIQPEGTDVVLRADEEGLAVFYRLAPSTVNVFPLTRAGVPRGAPRSLTGVLSLDGAALARDAVAVAWTEASGGTSRVSVVVADRSGVERGRVMLEESAMGEPMRAAVVPAWPGFVVAWRIGEGDAARLRIASVTIEGMQATAAVDWIRTPNATGKLFAVTDGAIVTVGQRTRNMMGASLSLARRCVPR